MKKNVIKKIEKKEEIESSLKSLLDYEGFSMSLSTYTKNVPLLIIVNI